MKSELATKTILLTRDEASNRTVAPLLEERGARVVSAPMIQIADPGQWQVCDEAIAGVTSFDAIVFTSHHAVERFLLRVKQAGSSRRSVLAAMKMYVVGDATAAALSAFGYTPTATGHSSAEELASIISAENIRGKRFLFPRSDIARPTLANALRQHGAVVEDVTVYRNLPPTDEAAAAVVHLFRTTPPDAVLFFSPSAVRNFCAIIRPDQCGSVAIGTIGGSTAAEIAKQGLRSDLTADRATGESLVTSLVQFFERTT